jgi:hypothetical protein
MLREEDIRIHVGRCVGGTFLQLVHVPTGIFRTKGPLGAASQHQLVSAWTHEIETELIERGLTQYIVPDFRTKHTRQGRRHK